MIWVSTIITVAVAFLLSGLQANDCPACDDVDEPICGRSEITGQIKTFKNECLMKADNCAGLEEHTFLNKGECLPGPPECLAFCNGIEKTICAIHELSGTWVTFPSECLLNQRNCVIYPGGRKIAEGPCPNDCPPCVNNTELHIPVCGKYSNGITATFSNNCALLLENCKAPDEKILHVSNIECQPVNPKYFSV